jgi:hypothetical protein
VFTKTLLGAVALNNLACILLFEVAHMAARVGLEADIEPSALQFVTAPLRQLLFSAGLGGVLGAGLVLMTRHVLRTEAMATASVLCVLLTAGLAANQGKEVFALPGRVSDRQSWGALKLLQDGAKLACCPGDVVAEFPDLAEALQGVYPQELAVSALPELTEPERQVWELLGSEPKHVDEIIDASGLTAAQVLSTLLVLEVKHVVRQHPGKLFTRVGG